MYPINKRLYTGATLSFVLLFTGCASAPNTDSYLPASDRVQNHLYAGIGGGISRKSPDQNNTNFDVNDRVSAGGQLTIGMDLSRQMAIELHTADLGQAEFEGGGSIDYDVHGGSVLLYAGKNRHNFKRRGFSGYARGGVGYLQNRSDNIPFRRVNQAHLLLGAGVEYMFAAGLGLRLEGISFDDDVRYAQLGLVYRTGRQTQRLVQQVEAPAPKPIVAAAKVEAPDLCAGFIGNLNGVNFHNDSAHLTSEAATILNGIATDLADCPAIDVTVSAHTDSSGPDEYNQALSERRAHAVAQHLETQGISRGRLRSTAFGESQPIESNDTAYGRSQNRRVEIVTE